MLSGRRNATLANVLLSKSSQLLPAPARVASVGDDTDGVTVGATGTSSVLVVPFTTPSEVLVFW